MFAIVLFFVALGMLIVCVGNASIRIVDNRTRSAIYFGFLALINAAAMLAVVITLSAQATLT